MRTSTGLALAAVAATLAVSTLLGCGKKAPPLPPLVGSKPRLKAIELRQVGATVRARFTMPVRAGATTIDYRTKGLELWRRERQPDSAAPGPPAPRPLGPPGEDQEEPGMPVGELTKSSVLAQSIAGDDLFDVLASPDPELVDRLPPELYGRELEYAIVLKTDIKSRGTVSDLAVITPQAPPPPPTGVTAEPAEGGIRLTWSPATDADGTAAAVNVYRAASDRPFEAAPLNTKPVAEPPFQDAAVDLDATYRYLLRSVASADVPALESDESATVTATWRDLFPPAVPGGLRAFVDAGKVTLLWTPGAEPDLLGYLVWRRVRGGDWTRLVQGPLPSATFTDADVQPGSRFEYSVSSLDASAPPNESARSAPVAAEIPAP